MAIVDAVQLAEILNVNTATVTKWVKLGCPIHQEGGRGRGTRQKYKTDDVVKWRIKKEVQAATQSGDVMDAEEAKRRKLTAEAGLAEIEYAKALGKVVDVDEVERALSNKYAELSKRLRKIPERVVMQLVGESDEQRIKTIILDEIDQVLDTEAEITETYDADEE